MKMLARLILIAMSMCLSVISFSQDKDGKIEELEKRIQKLERNDAMDRVEFTGDLRITADSIDATLTPHYDGMVIQKGMVDTLFYYGGTGMFPMNGLTDVNAFIAQNYSNYLYFKDGLTFGYLKQAVSMFDPQSMQMLMGMLMPGAYVPEQDYSNSIAYTTRLRLNMNAKVMENIKFTGRLTMYKAWGDSTGVQVFNGQPNSFSIDGTNGSTPNSDILRVERAYFDWSHLGGSNWYLSIGRRPSTEGPPIHFRNNELRQGTPTAHLVNFQFDGITIGTHYGETGGVFRFCYGVGFESGIGSADQLKAPADRLKDVHMGGFNWDIYSSDAMRVQATVMGAQDITDGFNGLIVMPNNVVTGDTIPGPMIMRFSPSTNLGNFYMGNLVMDRDETYFSWFASLAFSQSDPNKETTPFGGLLSDPFDVPEKQDGYSYYLGLTAPVGTMFFGLEYNYGSKYWFNFTQGADDLVASKLATRGSVFELYMIKNFAEGLGRARAKLKLSAMMYDYKYSGSGWQVGAPKELSETNAQSFNELSMEEMMSVPMLGFTTYDDVMDLRASLIVKF